MNFRRIYFLTKFISIIKEALHLCRLLLAIKKAEPQPDYFTVVKVIRIIAEEYNLNPDLAVKIARCESGLNPSALRRNPGGSYDRGLYQWNDKYHPEISNDCAFDLECSSRAFCEAVKEDHLRWWNSSKYCWSKT